MEPYPLRLPKQQQMRLMQPLSNRITTRARRMNAMIGLNTLPVHTHHSTGCGETTRYLSEPYGACSDYRDRPRFLKRFQCERECVSEAHLGVCGCVDDPEFASGFNVPFCNSTQEGISECLGSAASSAVCDCPPNCRDESYSFAEESNIWPAFTAVPALLPIMKQRIGNSTVGEQFLAKIQAHYLAGKFGASLVQTRSSYMMLTISLADDRELLHEERPVYDAVGIAGSLGGLLGLYFGCSVMTLLEVIPVSLHLLHVFHERGRLRRFRRLLLLREQGRAVEAGGAHVSGGVMATKAGVKRTSKPRAEEPAKVTAGRDSKKPKIDTSTETDKSRNAERSRIRPDNAAGSETQRHRKTSDIMIKDKSPVENQTQSEPEIFAIFTESTKRMNNMKNSPILSNKTSYTSDESAVEDKPVTRSPPSESPVPLLPNEALVIAEASRDPQLQSRSSRKKVLERPTPRFVNDDDDAFRRAYQLRVNKFRRPRQRNEPKEDKFATEARDGKRVERKKSAESDLLELRDL